MNNIYHHHRAILEDIADRAMVARGFFSDFSSESLAELNRIRFPARKSGKPVRDLTKLPWISIDEDGSHDLDQLTVGEMLPGNAIKVQVAVANVDALVKAGSALDKHARHNSTTVYTPVKIFPMLPEKLSTNLTSFNFNQDRLAIVVEMVIGADGSLQKSAISQAMIRNHARLNYHDVDAWLNGKGSLPDPVANVNGIEESLQLQDEASQRMKNLRFMHGALNLESIEARPVFDVNEIRDLEVERKNRATEIIENFMIATNGVTARYLSDQNFASIRRVVRTPKRWERIVEIAREHRFELPSSPDSGALEDF